MSRGFTRLYRTRDGRHDFGFTFIDRGSRVDVYCTSHPPLNGRDASVNLTHLFSDGQLCFVSGQEPRTFDQAQKLAAMWAEYYLEYRRTGIAQG